MEADTSRPGGSSNSYLRNARLSNHLDHHHQSTSPSFLPPRLLLFSLPSILVVVIVASLRKRPGAPYASRPESPSTHQLSPRTRSRSKPPNLLCRLPPPSRPDFDARPKCEGRAAPDSMPPPGRTHADLHAQRTKVRRRPPWPLRRRRASHGGSGAALLSLVVYSAPRSSILTRPPPAGQLLQRTARVRIPAFSPGVHRRWSAEPRLTCFAQRIFVQGSTNRRKLSTRPPDRKGLVRQSLSGLAQAHQWIQGQYAEAAQAVG
jgi:hypothetical protein